MKNFPIGKILLSCSLEGTVLIQLYFGKEAAWIVRGHMHGVPEYADLFLLIENIHLNKMVLVTNLTHLAIICFAGLTLRPRGLNFGAVHVVEHVYIAYDIVSQAHPNQMVIFQI